MNKSTNKHFKNFVILASISLVMMYVLFMVATTVRASGAGMGCPDWPKCFDMWIPPTSVDELPSNYQEIYADRGYKNTKFNALKTWTEYVNRLTSAVTGVFVLFTFFFAFLIRREYKIAWWGSVGALATVVFNAWLGSVVITSNLHPLIITSHMFFGIATIGFLLLSLTSINKSNWEMPKKYSGKLLPLLLLMFAMIVVQVGLGAQVREAVEVNQYALEQSSSSLFAEPAIMQMINWHAMWGMATFLVAIGLLFVFANRDIAYANKSRHQNLAFALAGAVFLNLMLGMLLSANTANWLKPLHLFIATIACSSIFVLLSSMLYGLYNKNKKSSIG